MALRNFFKIAIKQSQIMLQRVLRIHFSKRINYYCNNNILYKIPKEAINVNTYGNKNYATKEIYTNEMEQNDLEDIEIDDPADKILIRNLLYENSKDPLILQLNECASVQNVFNIIRENNEKMNPIHISQAVLVLWDLQKIFYRHNIYYESDSSSNSLLSANAILQNYMTQVNSHEDFEILIKQIEDNYEKFTLDALTCTLLYLNRMGVKLKANVMQLMIMRCEELIKNCDIDQFPLSSLSRFIVTIYSQESLYPILVSVGSMPIIHRRLETCATEEDFKLLTICLHKMKQLVSFENMENYKNLCDKLLKNKIITHPRTIIKTIRFLNLPQWFEYSSQYTNKFMQLLKGSIDQLTTSELVSLFKVFQMQKEPAHLLEEMQHHASKLLSESEENLNNLDLTLNLLSCIVSFTSPLQRPKFENIVRQYVKNNFTPISLSSLYKILYYVKSSDVRLCNYFWDKSLKYILNDTNNKLQNMLNLSFKYMHFSNKIGYRYRYYNFENSLIDYFNSELNSNILTLIPSKFARISSFIIAYSQDYNYVEKLLDQLLEMTYKFNSIDSLNISKGLQFLMENKDIRNNFNLTNRVQQLNKNLNDCINNELNNNPKLPNVNILLRSYIMRKGNINDDLFKKLLSFYAVNSNELTSYIIRDISFCLQINNCLESEVIDKITNYIINKKENILGSTVDKVLHLCYSLGYVPENCEEFLNVSSEIVIRDKEIFSGLTFLQSCLALCFYQKLPDILIKHIFSVDFLEKLDEELSNCYAKNTYPSRVRDYLMQLNRSVCLDYPQSDVPWFHQKYVEETKSNSPKKYFHKDVHSVLTELAKENNKIVLEDTFTPYGYYIDFELKNCQNMDENNFEKTAILLLNSNAFSRNTINLKGFYQLKQRHLEILGYNIININYSEWKSFYTQESCKEYLKNKIYPVHKSSSISVK